MHTEDFEDLKMADLITQVVRFSRFSLLKKEAVGIFRCASQELEQEEAGVAIFFSATWSLLAFWKAEASRAVECLLDLGCLRARGESDTRYIYPSQPKQCVHHQHPPLKFSSQYLLCRKESCSLRLSWMQSTTIVIDKRCGDSFRSATSFAALSARTQSSYFCTRGASS